VLAKGDAAAKATREELASRAIHIDPKKAGALSITTDGKIYQGKELVGEFSIQEFVDAKMLTKEGSSLFNNQVPANIVQDGTKTTVHQGMLETSNVNAVSEMTELLKATRMFESNEKLVKNYGDLESRAANDIGKL
jgi:flagellar basal-body rod protein FlgG